MREVPISLCEKEFILKALKENKRLDGRGIHDYRQLHISFGLDWGSCVVVLGNTRILAQVAVEVSQPKASRPAEGAVHIDVELSPMAAAHFSTLNRQSVQHVQLSRALKRCVVDAHVVDLESLCIVTGSKVWSVRVTVNILNYDGNLLDASSIATVGALMHFRRPDVSVCGEEVKIHTPEERDPLPLSIHHTPLCVTFACFEEGKLTLLDPDVKEERIMDGTILIAVNKHREICMLQAMGGIQLNRDQVLRFTNIAVARVTDITERIAAALEADAKLRKSGVKPVLTLESASGPATAASVPTAPPTQLAASAHMPPPPAADDAEMLSDSDDDEDDNSDEIGDDDIDDHELRPTSSGEVSTRVGGITIGEGGPSTWADSGPTVDRMAAAGDTRQQIPTPASTAVTKPKRASRKPARDSSGSEEEETVCLESVEQPATGKSANRGQHSSQRGSGRGTKPKSVQF